MEKEILEILKSTRLDIKVVKDSQERLESKLESKVDGIDK